jgi:hypothetical protein
VVLVATIRALKMHGGGPSVIPGRPLDPAYTEENLELLEAGLANLEAHIRNARRYGIPVVVAVNKFQYDTDAEIELVKKAAVAAGAETAAMSDHWANGGDGAVELAEAVVAACEKPSNFKFLYPLELSIKEKIETIAKEMYSAGEVVYEPLAERQIKSYEDNGFGNLPICMAKTHLSISHDPALKNAPSGYTLSVREVRASVGAGFIYPLLGEMRTMPGLGSRPAYMQVDLDEERGAQLAQDAGGLAGLLRRVVGDTDVQRLALLHRRVQRDHRLLQGSLRVGAVGVEDVDVVEAHPAQALVERGQQVLAGAPFAVRARPHQVSGLGGDDQLVAVRREVAGQVAAEVLLRPAVRRAVVVGQVEVRDPAVEGVSQEGTLRVERDVVAEVPPEPQRDRGQEQAARADLAERTAVVAIGCRLIRTVGVPVPGRGEALGVVGAHHPRLAIPATETSRKRIRLMLADPMDPEGEIWRD